MHDDIPIDSDSNSTEMATAPETLSAVDARIVGCLIEKEATTPETYPLTANAIVVACNQKTSRDPVMALEPGAVGHALRGLEDRKLVSSVHGARVQRYEHRFDRVFSVTTQQRALLAMLMLRGPQTHAELLTRCERLAQFDDLDQVREALDRLAQRSPPLVVNLGRASGQREDRAMHLLCGPVAAADFAAAPRPTPGPSGRTALESRIDQLETDVAELQAAFTALRGG